MLNSDSNASFNINNMNKYRADSLCCLPFRPGSYQSPGCWCQAQASLSNQWDKPRLPDHPGARLDSCST